MAARKVDFVVEQSVELEEAVTDLKAGSHVTLNDDVTTGRQQVCCEGYALGQVPTDQQQQLEGSSCTCTVRSIRKQDGKITQILVRAILSSSAAEPPPGTLLYLQPTHHNTHPCDGPSFHMHPLASAYHACRCTCR